MSLAIKVEDLSKKFYINSLRSAEQTLQGSLRTALKTAFFRAKSGTKGEILWALQNVSFEVKQGQSVGIVGGNGAGKSTLLKILSRITKPTMGRVKLNGRLGSLLEVGTGFHPELSGRENVFLNGAIIGMKNREVRRKFDAIVDFAEVEKFIDTPVKFYSSGMYMRLAFAVAAHFEPEILMIDEVLAVGDAAFQSKCIDKINEVANDGRTVIFVSHNDGALHKVCQTGIYLEQGQVKNIGAMSEILLQYQSDYQAKSADI